MAILLMLIQLAGCGTDMKDIGNQCGLDLKNAKALIFEDTHGGFLGDGTKYAKIALPETAFMPGQNWQDLPMTDIADELASHTFTDKNGNRFIPEISEGMYYFEDRQGEGDGRYSDAQVLERYSINCTMAVYDSRNEILYFYELDT